MTLTVVHDASGRIIAAAKHSSDRHTPRPVAGHGHELVELELNEELKGMSLRQICETHDIHALKRKLA